MPRTWSRRSGPPSAEAERTTLAWSRTALSLVGLNLIVARSLAAQFGAIVAVVALAGTFLAIAAMHRAHRRYRHWTVTTGRPYRPGAGNVAMTAIVAALGIAVLTTLVSVLTGR
ncbi:DUF202 domain-containing protein [Actinoplanes sp. NPDC051411]|uniref:DUF202 domain-containing protein n=1 Tax=Actinoplanes sp. NPDC051411 TaxID=3155522 RepID=UPI003420596E